MPTTLIKTVLMDNTWSGPLLKKEQNIIGMNGLDLNLMLEVKSARTNPPDTLTVKIEIKEPHRGLRAKSSIPEPLILEVPRFLGTLTYRLNISASAFAVKMIPEGQMEFATVVRYDDGRMPASADVGFREELLRGGWSWRGKGRQGRTARSPSGSAIHKEPDAKRLMLAGGVELLEITVQPRRDLVLRDAKTWAFLRSPADVFLYTGHGGGNALLTHGGTGRNEHDTWLTADELLQYWTAREPFFGRQLFDLDVLIINGCTVLDCQRRNALIDPPGLSWAKLLMNQGGSLYAILGYRGGAPSDSLGGHAVALEMAKRITSSLRDNWLAYAPAWLAVNRELDARFPPGHSRYSLSNACAIDLNGFHTLDRDLNHVIQDLGPGGARDREPIPALARMR